jgi:putative lipoprotein (rSAM/lipoprotein system)
MKRMNKTVLKSFNVLLAALLGILGFTNCETREEYGTPHSDYIVKGKVVDKATGKSVSGLKISLFDYRIALMYGTPQPDFKTITFTGYENKTDSKGAYQFDGNSFYSIKEVENLPLSMHISDIDGAENGVYGDTIIEVNFKDAQRTKKASGWFDGEYVKNVNIELPEKK